MKSQYDFSIRDRLGQIWLDTDIHAYVKIENFIFVSLDLRSLSQTTIPAELPSGLIMGERIDNQFKPQVQNLRQVLNPKDKLKLISRIKNEMERSFETIVEGSNEYRALNKWVGELGLKVNKVQVRPLVHEFYIYKTNDVLKQLQNLMKERGKLRAKVMIKPDPSRGNIQLAFPEEFDKNWVRAMGSLLGYPKCCVDRYSTDRESGINTELRASNQLKECESADPHAYFNSYFFPCSPICEKAIEKGKYYYEKLTEVAPELAQVYAQILRENLNRVSQQPEIIRRHLERLRDV